MRAQRGINVMLTPVLRQYIWRDIDVFILFV